jgi:hypothetical protein
MGALGLEIAELLSVVTNKVILLDIDDVRRERLLNELGTLNMSCAEEDLVQIVHAVCDVLEELL